MRTDPGSITATLAQIDDDLAERVNSLENSARIYFKAKRDYEYEYAKERLRIKSEAGEKKLTTTDLDNQAVVNLYKSSAYKELVVAEADYEATKATIRVLETRSTIGMALLKTQRELVGG